MRKLEIKKKKKRNVGAEKYWEIKRERENKWWWKTTES